MKNIYIILFALLLNITTLNAVETKCDTVRDKINPSCSKILKGTSSKIHGFFDGLRKFSEEHKTIDDTRKKIKKN